MYKGFTNKEDMLCYEFGVLQSELLEYSDLTENQIAFISLALSKIDLDSEKKVEIMSNLLNFYS